MLPVFVAAAAPRPRGFNDCMAASTNRRVVLVGTTLRRRCPGCCFEGCCCCCCCCVILVISVPGTGSVLVLVRSVFLVWFLFFLLLVFVLLVVLLMALIRSRNACITFVITSSLVPSFHMSLELVSKAVTNLWSSLSSAPAIAATGGGGARAC